MNNDSTALSETFDYPQGCYPSAREKPRAVQMPPPIPDYLQDTYWWAYLHPKSIFVFEREWVVNLILWGNMNKLTQAVLNEMKLGENSRVLQLACVYGNFSNLLAAHLDKTQSRLELVDVAALQLRNARKKLADHQNVGFHLQDSNFLSFPDHSVDQTVVFFLLHEQPDEARRKTIAEAIRVTRPGGKAIFVDYHGPRHSNPLRYIMLPILFWLEPFAMDLWHQELTDFMPAGIRPEQIHSQFYFGGLYQKVVVSL